MSLCRYSALKEVKLTECQDPRPIATAVPGGKRTLDFHGFQL